MSGLCAYLQCILCAFGVIPAVVVFTGGTHCMFVFDVGSLQFFPRYQRFDAGEIKGFTLLISVRNDHRPMYQLHLVRTNGDLVKMETAPSYARVVPSWQLP